MSVNFNTSRNRFDEWKRFTGLYQRMGTVAVDAEWNEEVRLRSTDARRRSADLADGSPDDGFRICADFLIDPITAIAGWTATGLLPGDERRPVPELRLDRHDPESLPWVVRSRWHTALRRTLPAPIDLTAITRDGSSPFAASQLVFELRLERPAADDEEVEIRVLIGDAAAEAQIRATTFGLVETGWCEIAVPIAQFTGVDLTRITRWGVAGLPPLARTWIGGLRAVDAALGTDAVIRGGDGTLAGSGRIFAGGHRAFIARDLRYSAQPDFPEAEALPALPGGADPRRHLFYLDVWEQTVTALDDPSLLEPALDGIDTTARLRTIAQIRALPLVASAGDERLPSPTGGGTLTTNIAAGALPDRDPPEPFDPCRDRCLFTENASTGDGYIGSDNLHVRIQVLRAGSLDVALWSRDNGSTVMALTQTAAADATSIRVAPADAARLRAGDIVVVEDRATRLRWDAPTPPVLRRLRGVQADTGTLELDEVGATITTNPVPLPCGGPIGRVFSPSAGATVRRWDGADLLVTDVRYRLSDGITFAFAGTGWRSGDYWTFTARVHAPDGVAVGVVEQLTTSAAHGPVHHFTPLARATGAPRVLEDLRPRYLPLGQVRDRLKELGERRVGPGVFVVVVGDGVRTFGDIDQAIAEGLTGDEAIQAALDVLGDRGGSIFLRAGHYQLEHPVLLRSLSSVRILGDGDATLLDVRGAGGAFYIDRCGADGAVGLEDLRLIENPGGATDIGDPGDDLDVPSVRIRSLFDRLIERRFSPIAMPAERPIVPGDIRVDGGVPDFLTAVGERIKVLPRGEGRVAGSVVASLIELRRIQRLRPDDELEDIAEAQPFLAALSALPHGVVTIADSRQVSIRRCRLTARRPEGNGVGVLVTGTCNGIEIAGNRIAAATGVAAIPYAPYLANTFLVGFPRAGLWLDGIGIIGNEIRGNQDAAATGVHLADGRLSGAAVDGNLIEGFTVGVLVADQAETGRDAATDRIVVRQNRIVGVTAIGVQVDGDGVDVTDNEIAIGDGGGLFRAGVQLSGHSARVAGCWIEIPPAPNLAPFAILAGIVVGDGIDDGTSPTRPVYDVEIAENRIEGAGERSPAIGVIVGGPQPIYDVRVRDNVIRNLGDAALRTWSTSGPVGRLHVEDNRIERVALGSLSEEFPSEELDRLQPGILASLPPGTRLRPVSLLAALTASSLPAVRAPLDAVLRWIDRLSLRGAIVAAGLDGGVIRGNHVAEIGTGDDLSEGDVGRDAIRTAAIAVVGAADVVVADNQIEAVRAPYGGLEPPTDEPDDGRPDMLDVLASLGFGSATTRIDRSDVHLAVVDLRSRLIEYARGASDVRARVGRTIYGPLDAAIGELSALGGAAAGIAENLSREAGALRSAQTYDQHTVTANRIRGTLTQASSVTAPDGVAQDTWDAAAQLDAATLVGAEAVAETARRLRQRLDSLVEGMPPAFQKQLQTVLSILTDLTNSLEHQLLAATLLGDAAALRDLQARRRTLPTTSELVGPRKTIVKTFVDAALGHLDTPDPRDNLDRIDELRKAKDALIDQLSKVEGPLASDLAADFRDVARTGGTVEPAIARMRATLLRVRQHADGVARDGLLTPEDSVRAAALARSGTIHLFARSVDRQIGGLATESDETLEKSLTSFHTVMSQLGEVTNGEPDLDALSAQAAAAVRVAAADPSRRRVQLGIARSILERLRGRLVDVLPVPFLPEPAPAEPIERRLAGLGGLALELADAGPDQALPALTGFGLHLEQVHVLLRADAGVRQRAEAVIAEAGRTLSDDSGPIRAGAILALVGLVDDTAERAIGAGSDNATLSAVWTLLHAARLAVDPADDAPERLDKTRAHLAARTSKVSASLVAQVQQSDLPASIRILHDAVARIARGAEVATLDVRPPQIVFAPQPADGVFVAGVERRARITGNQITEAVSGVVVAGAAGHLVTEAADDGMALEVGENRLYGCTVRGLEVRSDGACKVVIWDNVVSACAGIAVATADPWGQAVLAVSGRGDLVVRNNVLSDNGNTALRVQVHEIAVDWRGPAGIRGNTVRHIGGGAGGAGIVVITDALDAGLIQRLAQTPFLGVEPAAAPLRPIRPMIRPDLLLSVRDLSSLAPQTDDVVEVGGLRQRIATAPILQRVSALLPVAAPTPMAATGLATRYLDRSRMFVAHPVVDFLRRPPIVFVPPAVRRAYDSIHVEGNDVDASGPALLLLSDGVTLIATTVVGNDLRSRGRAGAVYLRRTDSTVFTGNRCECLGVVTVAVLRVGKAPVTATGNVLVGAEPVQQVTLPPPPPRAAPGGVNLTIGIGGGLLQVPVDARRLLGSLDRRKNLATDMFAELLADVTTMPTASLDGVTTDAERAAATAGASGGTLSPAVAGRTRDLLMRRGTALSSLMLDAGTRAELAQLMPQGVEPTIGARTVYGRTAGEGLDSTTALRKLVDTITLHEEDPASAKTKIGATLSAAGGDPRKALALLDEHVLGLGLAKPTVVEAVENVSVIHDILGEVLGSRTELPPAAVAPSAPPPPKPGDHTLVVIGGTRVAAVGNAATAGIHVQDADTLVQLNP